MRIEVFARYEGPDPRPADVPAFGLQPRSDWSLYIKIDDQMIQAIDCKTNVDIDDTGKPSIVMTAEVAP